jgi:iron complex outermembrane receptor protein
MTNHPNLPRAVAVSSRSRGVIIAALIIAMPRFAASQTQPAPPTAPAARPAGGPSSAPAEPLTTVVVTGTSIQSADAGAYQSAPITVITSDAIKNSGATSLEAYFQTQPDFILSGQSSYSNTGGGAGGNLNGTSIGATTLNLRGIGPQYTLVLVNGRRFQSENPANIDLIPVDAIERIEVLKSGASAVYGSDAVAGVVNIITKHTGDGFSFGGYFGESGEHDSDTTRVSATWGKANDRLNVFFAAEYFDRAGLTQGQRALSANPDLSRFNSNFNYQPFTYSSLAQIFLPDGTGPLVLNQQAFSCGGFSRNPADYVPVNGHLYATGCDAKIDEDKRNLVNGQRKATFFASTDYTLANGVTLYADFDASRSLVDSAGLVYGADGYGDVNSPLNLSPIPATNYWNPFGVPIVAVTYGFPETGPQTLNVDTSAGRLNLGLKGTVGKIHYEVGGAYYYSYTNYFQYNLPVSAGLFVAENRPGAASINLFCNDCNTPAQIAGVFSGTSTQNWEEMAQINAHAYAPIVALPSGDINVAVGAEYQRDAFIVQPSAAILDHSFNDLTEGAVSAGRRYTAVYIEGQLPIFGNSFTAPGAASLGLDVAARYEDIERVGSRTDPTVSIRWEPIANSIAVRATYGTSFRAPPLTAVDAPTVSAGGSALINPATGQFADYTVVSGGNPNLKAETSSYTSYGLVLTPQSIPGLTLQIDRWLINQKNIVIQTSPQLVLDGIQPGGTFTSANGVPGVYSLFMNAAGQDVNGTDLDLDYRFRTDAAGLFDFRLTGTYLSSFRVDDETGSGFVQYAGGTALASSLPSVSGLPKIRALFAVNWQYRALSATYLLHYTSSYDDPEIPPSVRVDSYVTHDIQFNIDCSQLVAASSWLAPLKLTVGVNDLTYAKVPIFYSGPSGGGNGANGYDTSVVNPTGRFIYAAFHMSFPHNRSD